MDILPLIHILFWIAMAVAPRGTTQIIVTGPDMNLTWTNQDGSWKNSDTQNVWTTDDTSVTTGVTAGQSQKKEVAPFVKGVKQQDWSQSPTLQLGPMTSLAKVGETFVYTLNAGDPSERRYTIAFKQK